MKKLFVITCISVAIQSSAQISFGIKAGISVPAISATYPADYAAADGGHFGKQKRIVFGGFADIPLRKNLFFRAGAELAGKGASFKSIYSNGSFDVEVQINTIDFPVSVIYKTAAAGKRRVMVGGGMVPGIFVRSNSYSISTQWPMNLGLNALAGYEFPIGLSFNINYSHGLLNVVSSPREFQSLRLHYLGLTIGYFF